jgi:hypothetical protein
MVNAFRPAGYAQFCHSVYSNPASEYCPFFATHYTPIRPLCRGSRQFHSDYGGLLDIVHAEAVIASSLNSPAGSADSDGRVHSKLPSWRRSAK